MFKRKLFVVALLAVVLLSSLMDGGVDLTRENLRKPRRHGSAAEGAITAVDQNLRQVRLSKLVNTFTSPSVALDPDAQLALRGDNKPRIRRHNRADVDRDGLNEIAGARVVFDPNCCH